MEDCPSTAAVAGHPFRYPSFMIVVGKGYVFHQLALIFHLIS